jgi:hypothetical protein
MYETINNQYISSIKKGDPVTYGITDYRVQDDGKGWLHIIVIENGKRKKIALSEVLLFEYGSEPDYIFNKWWIIYPSYEIFKQYASAEIAWLKN